MTQIGVREQVARVEQEAWRVASLMRDPALIPAVATDELYGTFDRIERAAKTAKLLLAKRVEASGSYKERGHANAADYLAQVAGGSIGAARKELETSERLESCDRTKEALLKGDVSPEQGAIIADAAVVNPEAERSLLGAAKRTNHRELKDKALQAKAAKQDREAMEEAIRKDRRLTHSTDAEGAALLFGRGPVTDAALVQSELSSLIDEVMAGRGDRPLEARSAYEWDALGLMARYSRLQRLGAFADPTQVSDDAMDAADDEAGSEHAERGPAKVKLSGRRRTGRKRPPPSWLALLHVDVAALQRGSLEDGERCVIPGVGPVSIATAREILGEAALRIVITRGVDVLNVTTLAHRPTQAMRYAWLWTNPTCIVEGCTRTRVEFDHIYGFEYAKTLHTCFVETEPKCGHHHKLHTLHGWELVVGTGRRPLVPPEHPDHPKNHPDGAVPQRGRPPPMGERPPPDAGPPPPAPGPGQGALFGDAA